MAPGRARLAAAAALAAIVAAIGTLNAGGDAAAAGPGDPPNVVVVFTDDHDAASLKVMKGVKRKLGVKGLAKREAALDEIRSRGLE